MADLLTIKDIEIGVFGDWLTIDVDKISQYMSIYIPNITVLTIQKAKELLNTWAFFIISKGNTTACCLYMESGTEVGKIRDKVAEAVKEKY